MTHCGEGGKLGQLIINQQFNDRSGCAILHGKDLPDGVREPKKSGDINCGCGCGCGFRLGWGVGIVLLGRVP